MKKIELTNEEILTIENFALKQQVIDARFAQLDQELKKAREANVEFWKNLGIKYNEDFVNKKINLNGNIVEVFDSNDNSETIN